jgi:hypothetical protein
MTPRITSTLVRLRPLVALLVFALIPYGWIAEANPWMQPFLYTLFATEAAHAVGHSLIFAAVGWALLACFPGLLARPWRYLLLILIVALAQEGLQLAYKGRGIIVNDLTDIGIDLVAAAAVFALARRVAAARATERLTQR